MAFFTSPVTVGQNPLHVHPQSLSPLTKSADNMCNPISSPNHFQHFHAFLLPLWKMRYTLSDDMEEYPTGRIVTTSAPFEIALQAFYSHENGHEWLFPVLTRWLTPGYSVVYSPEQASQGLEDSSNRLWVQAQELCESNDPAEVELGELATTLISRARERASKAQVSQDSDKGKGMDKGKGKEREKKKDKESDKGKSHSKDKGKEKGKDKAKDKGKDKGKGKGKA
jgi:hypothetical protein